jgi:hypothetical protein
MRSVILAVVVLGACHPRLSVGYDATAHTRGPLANLQAIPRIAAITGAEAAPPPAEGTNYSLGVGFGDRRFTVGLGVHAMNVSGSTLEMSGPQYVSAAASMDFRFAWLTYKGFSANMKLAPTRTLLMDSTSGDRTWGSGVQFGGGLSYRLAMFSVYADAYQERTIFFEGPAQGNSTRTGMTLGLAFQP